MPIPKQTDDEQPTAEGTSSVASRRFLLVTGSAALGGAALPAVADHSTGFAALSARDAEDVIAGTVDHVDAEGILYLRDGIGAKGIKFTKNATFWRDHAVDLNAFVAGDLVAAEGERTDGMFVSSHLTSVYVVASGRLVERGGNQLRTTDGEMRLTRDSYVHDGIGIEIESLNELSAGDEVIALGREDPELGFVAIAVSIQTDE